MTIKNSHPLNRREFIKGSLAGLISLPSVDMKSWIAGRNKQKADVVVFKTLDRKQGVKEVLQALEIPKIKGKEVFIKPNFNTADPAPASTHNDTLSQLVREFHDRGSGKITVGERSGPPATKSVLEQKGIFRLAQELEFAVVNFEELGEEEWVHFNPPDNHWENGFSLAKPAVDAKYFVSTCCLKTHKFGGVFTMSLKLSVGLTPKGLMRELHQSPNMRKMIAEINTGYTPDVIVLDGVDAFVDGGPMEGTLKKAGVFLAGSDRIAVDAAAIAVLKDLGSNEAIMGKKIFEQEQIKRAVELGLGIKGPEQIEFIAPDRPSRKYAENLIRILENG